MSTKEHIDLIFANQPNLIVNKGTHPSLHENCQHQITFAKATLRVEYPPPYKRHVWNYAKANVNGINKAISQFNWQGSFTNLPINEQVNLFNSTLMNIFSNFIPNKTVTFNDQDPPWFVEKTKAKIELNNRVYKQYVKNGRPEDRFDKPSNATFSNRIESAQYNAALAIIGTIRGTSKEKLYKELGFETMKDRRWFRRLCCFYKILNIQTPGYLYSLLVPPNRDYNARRYTKFRQIFCRTKTFSNSFLPQTIKEWNKLDTSICQAPSYSEFRKALLDFIRPTANSTFGTNDVSGLKLLTRLRVGFSHLREHKFKHNFQDTLNPLCPCSLEAEDTYHFFMR